MIPKYLISKGGTLAMLLLLVSFISPAQGKKGHWVKVVGKITERSTGNNLHDVQITVRNNITGEENTTVSKRGRYKLKLDLNFEFDLIFSRQGYITKFVRVDTRNIPKEAAESGLKMFVDMTLFKFDPDFDQSVFNEPIGIARFKYGLGLMSWDVEYSRERFEIIERAHARARGEIVDDPNESIPSSHPVEGLPTTVDYGVYIRDVIGQDGWFPIDEYQFRKRDTTSKLFAIGIKFMNASTLASQGAVSELLSLIAHTTAIGDSILPNLVDGQEWSMEVAEDQQDTSALMHWVDEYYSDAEQQLLLAHRPDDVKWMRIGLMLEGLRSGLRFVDSANAAEVALWVGSHRPVFEKHLAKTEGLDISESTKKYLQLILQSISSFPTPEGVDVEELSFSIIERGANSTTIDREELDYLHEHLNNFHRLVIRGEQ